MRSPSVDSIHFNPMLRAAWTYMAAPACVALLGIFFTTFPFLGEGQMK